ncbi:hypothetical protein M2132_000341 [Dysgonomonas sp. PH5-45]|uniref:DUF4350 domain-containing protein n=1 Tax=unclassified Dysgonomonas TaxID=2630389 RepID=UPI002474AEB1|nr:MULTISPECIES: DUF4350 domain-containing protein [unclassified Dysgonomonas]MDH6354021.1 hypothetical protein [Dysgonomonas sp. PH5-45]MDH6386923.1 hypothetical protein [Dysgonomonas sp. PH5-37]
MKNKSFKILLIVISVLMAGLIYVESVREKPVDWTPTFYNTDKIPFGTYITYNLLDSVFPKGSVQSTRNTVYEELYYPDYSGRNNDSIYLNAAEDETGMAYIFIEKDFSINKLDLECLLNFVYVGNDVFISAEAFSKNILDSLQIKANTSASFLNKDTLYTLKEYNKKQYAFQSIEDKTGLQTDSASSNYHVLGMSSQNDTTFVRIGYGGGNFYLHTVPYAFTNVALLNTDKYDYAFRCLSYLPQDSYVIWDEYHKRGDAGQQGLLQVAKRYPPLKMAITLTGIGIFLFLLFRSKRVQRIIPVIKPPVNSSLEFLSTISNVFYKKRDYLSIAENRYNFFLDKVRNRYYMRTEQLDGEFMKTLSLKSGVEQPSVERIFYRYNRLRQETPVSNATFIAFNEALEEFYKKIEITNKTR